MTVSENTILSGNVGIGTTEPMYKLEVNGDIYGKEIRLDPRKLQPLVTFIFDDGNATDYTIMKPIFDNQGEIACSAIATDLVGQTGELTWTQIAELQSAGWEILSHTKSHPDLTTLSEAQIRNELSESKEQLTDRGFTVKSIVYPGHYSNETVRRIAREYYRSARGSSGINEHVLETYNLSSIQADDHTYLDAFKAYVDTAESEEKWLTFHLHSTNSNDATTINELIDYIQAKGIQIVSVDQALDLVGNMIDGDNLAISEQGLRTREIKVGIDTSDGGTILHPGHYLYLQNEGYYTHDIIARPGGSTRDTLYTTLSLQNSDTSTPPVYTTGVSLNSADKSIFTKGIQVTGDTGAPQSGVGTEIGYYTDNYGWVQTFASKPLILNPLANYTEVGNGFRVSGTDVITTGVGIEMSYGTIADSGVIMVYDRDTSTYKDLRLRKLIVDNGAAKFSGSGAPSSGAGIELAGGSGTNYIMAYNRGATPSYLDLLIRGKTVGLGAGGNTNLYIDASGNIGIGTITPSSLLQLDTPANSTSKYLQIDSEAGVPVAADCDSESEQGRMIIDHTNNRIYICNQAAGRGWDYMSLTD